MKKYFYLFLSIAVSAGLVFFLLRQVKPADFASDLANLYKNSLFLYLFLHSVCVLIRAYRYKILIGSDQIGMGDVTLLTLVRNIFTDLVPARLGSLSYIYLLVKRFGFAFEVGASTLLISMLFDFIAVTPLVILSIVIVGFGGAPLSNPFFLISVIVLLVILLLLLMKLIPILRFLLTLFDRGVRKTGLGGNRKVKIILQKLAQTLEEIGKIKERKLYWKVFFISLLIRILKYGSLYFLLHSVIAYHGFGIFELSFWKVFLAFAGPEIASNLPVHGIGGFGTWELAWVVTFQAMGFARELAIRTGFIVHGITQLVEYAMGIIAIIILALPFHWGHRKS